MQTLLTDIITEHGAVVFNGDGYSENWQIEAAERGLPNLKTTPDALPELIKPETVALFEKYGVFNERELHSRYEVRLEQYALTIAVEAKLALELGTTVILPAAIRYQTELAQNVATLKVAGVEADTTLLQAVSAPITALTGALGGLLGRAGRRPPCRGQLRGSAVRPRLAAAGDGRGAGGGGCAGKRCRRRPLAAADLPGDAVHPVTGRASVPRMTSHARRAGLGA